MTTNTSIGEDEPDVAPLSGIDDEAPQRDGKAGVPVRRDLTREEIEAGNDQATSVDQGNRSGRTSHGSADDAIELGK